VVADETPQNTDTRRYWDLTRNIYRWRYFPDAANQGVSRVDIQIGLNAHGMVAA
jgi:Gly-Xaa carboxypeptidase